jgi:hypothetical protein
VCDLTDLPIPDWQIASSHKHSGVSKQRIVPSTWLQVQQREVREIESPSPAELRAAV